MASCQVHDNSPTSLAAVGGVGADVVVAAAQVLHEGMTGREDPR